MARITNLVLAERIGNLKESIEKRNEIEAKKITLLEEKTEKNTVSIAGIKGASGAIAFITSLTTTLAGIYFGMKN